MRCTIIYRCFIILLVMGNIVAKQHSKIIYDQKECIRPLDLRMKEAFLRIFQPNIPIPKYLQVKSAIQGIDVKHIRSYLQRGPSCSWYPILNAYAIQELVNEHKEITARAIEDIVLRIISYINENSQVISDVIQQAHIFEAINPKQQMCLAEHLGLQDCYPLDIEDGYFFWNNKAQIMGNSEFKEKRYYQFNQLKELITLLLKKNTVLKHFIIGTESTIDCGHAVLISLVRIPGNRPMIIYMDSNNVLLKDCSLHYVTPFFIMKVIWCLMDMYCENYAHDFYNLVSPAISP